MGISFAQPIVIAGAGIGGLTLAVCLHRRGIPVRVLERAASLAPVGAGITLQPNAMSVIQHLSLAGDVIAAGKPVGRTAILNDRGDPLGGEQDVAALSAPFGVPAVAIHRARLHQILQHALAPDCLELGREVLDYEVANDAVTVHCPGGLTVNTNVLIGADGLRSKVRQRLAGPSEPVYSGYTSWRGVTEPGRAPPIDRVSESWGRGERFGIVAIGNGEVYWFAVANAPPGGTDTDARVELLHRFGNWHKPIRAVLEATLPDRILRTDITDRDPIRRWHDGPVVLLGDAAHPMTPNLGQGACQAIEDAFVLADALATSATVEAAFGLYEQRRLARANAVVVAARRLGAIAQWSNPLAVALRDMLLRLTPDSVVRKQMQSLWAPPGK